MTFSWYRLYSAVSERSHEPQTQLCLKADPLGCKAPPRAPRCECSAGGGWTKLLQQKPWHSHSTPQLFQRVTHAQLAVHVSRPHIRHSQATLASFALTSRLAYPLALEPRAPPSSAPFELAKMRVIVVDVLHSGAFVRAGNRADNLCVAMVMA